MTPRDTPAAPTTQAGRRVYAELDDLAWLPDILAIEAEARSTPAEALPSEAEFWKAAGEWQKAGSGMTSEQETGATMVWLWLDSHGRSTPTEALDEDDDGPVGPVRITSANCFAGDHDECAGMVEQDAPELGITDCLCPHRFPARSTPAEALDVREAYERGYAEGLRALADDEEDAPTERNASSE